MLIDEQNGSELQNGLNDLGVSVQPAEQAPATVNDTNFQFVQVNEFQPNADGWNTIGQIIDHKVVGHDIYLTNTNQYQVKVSFLSPSALRVRFKPYRYPNYEKNNSYTVVNHDLGNIDKFEVSELDQDGGTLKIDTGVLQVYIGLNPYGISVQKDGKVITEDTYGKNIVFSNEAIANLKKCPDSESFYGFGEKAGDQLDKKKFSLTFFNYDNFTYNDIDANGGKVVPENNEGGPLNPSSPLYNSMPFALAVGKGNENIEYAYGLFFDNVSQSYFNLGSNDYSNMDGKYYFGALYGELDYYIMVGNEQNDETTNAVTDVLNQYAELSGKSSMPPMYAFGYQQGCYGYYDRWILMSIAQAYRAANIPIDGLHIDVDFQNNYRTFTNSENKFPNVGEMFDTLHDLGYKCSTNITGIITANPLDENGNTDTPYPTRDSILNLNDQNAAISEYKEDAPVQPFIFNTRAGEAPTPNIFIANESYGVDTGLNPFKYPTPAQPEGTNELGTYGFYSDMGDPKVQEWWGEQYDYLLKKGLDMIWQDMTCPAVVPNFDNGNPDKTLPLNLMMYDKVTEEYQPNAKIHNSFALNLVQATFEGIKKLKLSEEFKTGGDNGQPLYNYNKRNFIISRGGFAGVHRYAGIWTGDSASSWDFLAINVPEVLNVGLSGLPISGCDIGGFANGSGSEEGGVTNYELFTRWITAGAFLPWYRNHYDGYTKTFQEPYRFGTPVPENCRKYINIRYRLLQLFYDSMYENTQTGMPICRAMFVNEVNDPSVFDYADHQFFIGKDLLVAPVINQNWMRDVYLPSGSNWYVFDIEGGKLPEPTQGGQVYSWYVPLDLVPVYIREGAILPVRELEQYVGQKDNNIMTFYIYPGPESSYQLYQDDKTTMDAEEQGEYRVTEVMTMNGNGSKQVNFKRVYEKNYVPNEKYFQVKLLGNLVCPESVSINGKQISKMDLADFDSATSNAWYYDSDNEFVMVKVEDNASELNVFVAYPDAE
ncbi:glycoside hydrolase family 31 protein [Sediminitomix flava]|uniref:Alpha-glucosidase n=1 Tax=Sediminitomix flava TaxID=379075 RepID=A0A315ZCD2_SEDFL|nr:TIM-barrel domain-containing protein [Sediminitomix flava]PWJ43236.1 alpha-glucosidase [Sediminitomix flava]